MISEAASAGGADGPLVEMADVHLAFGPKKILEGLSLKWRGGSGW